LAPLGLGALVIVGWRLWSRAMQRRQLEPLQINLLLFGAGIFGVTGMVMFYYWAALNDPMAARFALPLHLLLVLAIVAATAWGDRKWPVSAVALGLVGAFILGSSAPRQSFHFYSHLGNDEIAWEERVVAARPAGTRLMLTNKSTLPWLINNTTAIVLDRARMVADRLAEQLRLPDFSERLVTHGARP